MILHGILGSSRNWQTAGRDLAERNHVYALDLRNHGSSPHAAEAGYEAMMGDVLAWIGSRGFSRIALLGHSMGGKVAMLLACRRPELVERLIVVDIAPKDYAGAGRHREFAAMTALDLSQLRSRAEAEKKLEAAEPDWAMRKFLTTNLDRDEAGRWRWTINLPALTTALRELEGNPLAAGERYLGPSLFILGGRSRYVAPDEHPLITTHFPAARIETIADSGHNPHIETREALVRIAAGFLAEAA